MLTDEQGEELIRLMRKPEEYLGMIVKMQRVEEFKEMNNNE